MATRHVVVFLDGQILCVAPGTVRLVGDKDRLQVHNNTNRKLIWRVPAGAFTDEEDFTETIDPEDSSTKPKAKKVTKSKTFRYTITEARARAGKRRRRARGSSDPEIIIDP